MKTNLFIILFTISIVVLKAEKIDSSKSGFGLALNSEYNTQFNTIEIIPTAFYYFKKSQFELGAGFNPFDLKHQRVINSRFNYKFFPNGRDFKFNMYFLASCIYTNQLKKTYYTTTNQYLAISGGYGFQVKIIDNFNIGTNLNLGLFTKSTVSKNPYISQLEKQTLFNNIGTNLAFQVNLSYRF